MILRLEVECRRIEDRTVMSTSPSNNQEDTGEADVLNASEAAAYLSAHVETLRRLARRGEIPSFKVGKDWRFSRAAIRQWSEEHRLRVRPSVVLVIDDDEMSRECLRVHLQKAGHTVLTANSGPQGLEKASRQSPDLILLDLWMPGMSGPSFLQKLRIDHPELPVIVVTGFPDSALMSAAMAYGPLTVIPKPFDREQLQRAVRMATGRG